MRGKFEDGVNVVVQHIILGFHGRVHAWQYQRTVLDTVGSEKNSRSQDK